MNWRAIFVLGIGLGLSAQQLRAQPIPKSDLLTIPKLQARIQAVQTDNDLVAGTKEQVLQYLQAAIERIEIAQDELQRAEEFERRLSKVSAALQATESRLSELARTADPAIANVKDLDELDRMVETRERQLEDPETGLRKQIADLSDEAARWRVRPEELITELSEVEDRLSTIEDEFDGLAASGEEGELLQAHKWFLAARRQRAQSEHRAIQAESEWYQSAVAADLLQAQQEFAAKNLTWKLAELEILNTEVGRRRSDEADQRVQQAQAIVSRTVPSLKPIAEENLGLALERREVALKRREIDRRHEATSAALSDLTEKFKRTQTMVDKVGPTDSIGLMLRQQRAKLLNPRSLRSELSRRNELVRESRMRLFQLESDRNALIDLDAAILKRSSELDLAQDRKSMDAGIRDLLVEQRQLCNGLEDDYTKYFNQLIELDCNEKQLLELTTKYADYVDERVLWIRTGQSFGRDHLTRLSPSFRWISDGKLWKSVVDALWQNGAKQPFAWGLAAVLLTLWLGTYPLLVGFLQRQGAIAAEISCRQLRPTLQTMAATLTLACGLPTIIGFLGWRLDHSSSTVPFVHAVAAGFLRAATFALPLEVLRVICFRGGLADRHFDWPPGLVNGWRRNLNWFLPVGIFTIGVIGLIEGTADEHRLDSFGRLMFLVFTAFSAVFCQLTIQRGRSRTKIGEGTAIDETDRWSDRFWQFAPSLAVLVNLGLFALGWSGYFYTALQLTWRLQSTAWFAVGLLLLRATIRRWILLERRRMAVLQDQELQSIAESGREPGNQTHNPFLFPKWSWPDFRLNLTQIVTQMRSLLDTGLLTLAVAALWFVWADVTPALNILDNVTLWQTTVEQTVSQGDAKVGPSGQKVSRIAKVTAANLGLAILIVAIAVIAGRNIPGLVEVILVEHLSVDAGSRFAATCLVRYAIFLAGISGAFAQIGIGWNNIQWLVAAASVGLGFGLQEIFGNFVSGIILLFERPMRVGDVITIGDTTGTVSRIRFRATTIVDGDRKELIVPNKEFITGKLLNWTLSDRVNRVGVKIVVGSNNDPQRIRRLLLEIAAQQPQLLKDPAPTATLEELNGGLTFMLRGFLPTLEGRSSAIHDLYTIIHSRFRAEGIEMPCPSQEVFVRMDAPSASLPAPHQSGVPIKPPSTDFSNAFRRA